MDPIMTNDELIHTISALTGLLAEQRMGQAMPFDVQQTISTCCQAIMRKANQVGQVQMAAPGMTLTGVTTGQHP